MGMPRDKIRPANPQSGTHREKTRPANPQSGTHRDKTRPAQPPAGALREKTRPANPQSGTHRDKTRPARQNSAVLAYFRSAGRKISRFLRRHSTQGEFYPANHHTLATLGTLTGTKLSGHTACKAATGTKLSPHTACKATTGTKLSQHSKKHPNQPIRGEQGENYPGRDPLETQTTDAGRILSRKPPHTSHAGHTHRYKTLRAHSV